MNTLINLLFLVESKCAFILVGNNALFELQKMNLDEEGKSSWFVDDKVVQDGSLFCATKFDPLFLLIKPLSKALRKVNSMNFFCLQRAENCRQKIIL
jgi:hypothetical protein